jgi:predicted amidohydrolase
LIGRDSWYPRNYTRLNEQGADLIAVPAFVVGQRAWAQPWRAENLEDAPSVEPHPQTEGEAWRTLTLAPISARQAGISVFMRGQFWDQGSAGHSFANRSGHPIAEQSDSAAAKGLKPGHGAQMINLWL